MKTKLSYLAVSCAILFMAACAANSSKEEYSRTAAPMDEVSAEALSMDSSSVSVGNGSVNKYISSSAAVVNKNDTTHKFIRTADLKFKVKDVIKTTYTIEDIAARFDGFVTYTKLNSNIDNRIVSPISADSSLETTFFTVENTMIIRIPNTQLDTTLKCIAKLVDFLDYRIIKADDVSLNMLSNKLTQLRVNRHEVRLEKAIDERGKKLHETTDAEQSLLNKQEQADDAKIRNMELQDRIDYSTINLMMYQRQDITRELVSNYKNIDVYEPGLGTKLMESLRFGWGIVEGFILFLAKIWAILILAVVLFFLFKRYGDRMKK